MTKKPLLEKKLENSPRLKVLRKEENHNSAVKYCKLMDYCLEIGFFYDEARKYVKTMVKRR